MPSARKAPQGGETVRVVLSKYHPGQQAIMDSPARWKVVMCGRRFGKTNMGIRAVIEPALRGYPTAFLAPTYKLAGEAWREILKRLGPVITRSNEQDRRVEIVGGGVCEVWSLDTDDPARGRKYKRVVVDESGLVVDLLGVWNAAIRPTLIDMQGDALFLGTPKGRRSGFIALFNRGNDPEYPEWESFRAPTISNPYIAEEEIEQARRELPPDVFAQEMLAIPMDDGASVFGLDALKKAEAPLSTQPTMVYGADLARSVDYTVVIGLDAWCNVSFVERWQSPWGLTKPKIAGIANKDGNLTPVVADATGVGDAITSDLSLMGVLVTPYVFTSSSKTRLIQRLITAFQSGSIKIPNEPQFEWLRAELSSFEFTYTASGVKYEAPPGQHDDGVCALALALHGWDRVVGAPPEAPPGLRQVGDDPYIARESEQAPMASQPGDFVSQLPIGGW